jgi:hypothetical protein
METLNHIIRYVRKKNWTTIDNNYSDFGFSVYSGPDVPLFEIFNKAVVVEGIYSSITLSVDFSVGLQNEKYSEHINILLNRFFSVNYLESEKEKIVELNTKPGGQLYNKDLNNIVYGKLKAHSTVFIEATNNSRVILLINLESGIIRFSVTDLEHSGIYLPIHALLEQSIERSRDRTDHIFNRVIRIVKLSYDKPKLLFNNIHRYEFWYYGSDDNLVSADMKRECLCRSEIYFEQICNFMRELYGRENLSNKEGRAMAQQNEFRSKAILFWNIPEADVFLIKSSFCGRGDFRSPRKSACIVEIRIKPRTLQATNAGAWVLENLVGNRIHGVFK